MEVRIKYQVISKATISSISYNHQSNILAAVADGNDTASFFSPTSDLVLLPCFSGKSKPPSSGCVSWSPNGLCIAVANIKVELWKFDGAHMSPLRIINEGYIEIKNIIWSQDSQHYLCYGINPKDSPLSINIRHIQSNGLRQIFTQDIPVLANFDPFGKYIAVLSIKNILQFYDASTLDKIKCINLAQSKNDIPTLRDRRIADWSPQYSYFCAPNLNDSRLPSAIIFDRNRNFANKDILLGHQATISCLKFNPHIFEYESDTTFILAIGDSSGCLSLWRIGKTNVYKQPLLIFSSPNKAQQSIQNVQWNNEGNMLFVNVLKKYIVIIQFKLQDFGKKLNQEQKTNLIIATYGASGASEITGKKLQVFGQNDFTFKDQLQIPNPYKVTVEKTFQQRPQLKQNMVTTKQQVIYRKDANNKQKKRINPSRIVPESELKNVEAANASSSVVSNIVNINGVVTQAIVQKPKMPTIKLSSLKQEMKKQFYLPNGQVLQLQQNKNMYILSLRTKENPNKQANYKRFFNGQIKNITITRKHILVINSQKLFIFNFDLQFEELQCFLGNVSNFTANNTGTVFYMTTNGLIRGFNYEKHLFILETSISYLLLGSEESQIVNNPLSMFIVFDDDNDRLHVQLKSSLTRYFFCKQTNAWIRFDFNEGFYLPGHSLRVTKLQKGIADNFYTALVAPAIATTQQNSKIQSTVSQYQMQFIYYTKYAKDPSKSKDALIRMIADLKSKGNEQQLRKQIIKYFIDKQSQNYIQDPDIWQKVKKIGGKVIQQFLILSTL